MAEARKNFKPSEEAKKRKRERDRARGKTRVDLGKEFARWRRLKEEAGCKSDSVFSTSLLDCYEKVTPTPIKSRKRAGLPQPSASSISAGSSSDGTADLAGTEVPDLDWDVDEEVMEQIDSSSISRTSLDLNTEEINEEEFNNITNATIDWLDTTPSSEGLCSDSDSDCTPPLCVRSGGALTTKINVNKYDDITVEETVHDISVMDENQEEGLADDEPPSEAGLDTIGQPASLAYHSCLQQLAETLQLPFSTCNVKDPDTSKPCQAPRPFKVLVRSRASAAIIEWMCSSGHIVWRWNSQPSLKCGRETLSRLKQKPHLVALGNSRMDSPGFCAKSCTYTMMENESKEIISMEKVLPNLKEVCTDAHVEISALFAKGKYHTSGILHTLDMWHGSKDLGKKIYKASQKKNCKSLSTWTKDICNHFWFCAKTASTFDDFFDMWRGVLHHVTGEHEWSLGACYHGPLPDDKDKPLIVKGSEAHTALTEIVWNERWLKDVVKFLTFRSTSELESFHNHILMYTGKAFGFSHKVYEARTFLAGLDYNHHVHRPVLRNADGKVEYKRVFNKKSRQWRLYALKVEKDYAYIEDLQRAILQCWMSKTHFRKEVQK
uniref:Uncharacterized protein n=1 Tax=Knipowitschia caucasica TaxID=637954 RepID=A0AAV2LXL5_KNICA